MRLRLRDDVLDPHFFIYYVRSSEVVRAYVRTVNHGMTRDGINTAQLLSLPVPLAPRHLQRRIVDAIDSLLSRLDAADVSLQKAEVKLRAYRASVLKAAVEGRLVPTEAQLTRQERRAYEPADDLLKRILEERRRRWEDVALARMRAAGKVPKDDKWRTRYEEPEPANTTGLPMAPEGWTWARIYAVGDVQLGRQRSPIHHQGSHMRPYLRVANVFEDRIDTSDVMTMNFSPQEFETYRLTYGDILLNEGQSPHLIGRPAMYRDEVPGACFQNTLIRFRASSGLDARYALAVFRAQLHARRYMRIAQITTNIAHLGAGRFAEIEFPLPPLHEQQRIADEVERLMTISYAIERSLVQERARCLRLRQAIVKWAFEGKLVDQDCGDEPADALLIRISVERSAAEPRMKTRTRKLKSAS
jgi:type I restriction enzyme S subunit